MGDKLRYAFRTYKVDNLGRITIPIEIRRDLGIDAGEYIGIGLNDDVIEIRKIQKDRRMNDLLYKAKESKKFSEIELSAFEEMLDRLR